MTLWLAPSVLIVILLAVGPLGTLTGVLTTEVGWSLFFGGIGLSLLGLPVFGGAAALASATGKPWRSKALKAAVVPLLAVLLFVVPNLSKLNPVIHDITTDPQDSLQFAPDVAAARSERSERAQVLEVQRANFPDITSLQLAIPPQEAYALALKTAQGMPSWEIVSEDAATGQIAAVSRSRVFRFTDDVVIRVQEDPAGSRVDIRSRSRMGEGDFRVNVTRVRSFLDALRSQAS